MRMFRHDILRENISRFYFFTTTFWEGGAMLDDTTLPHLMYENEVLFCLQHIDDPLALPVSWSSLLAGETKKTIYPGSPCQLELSVGRRNEGDNLGEGGGLQVNVDITVTVNTTLPPCSTSHT